MILTCSPWRYAWWVNMNFLRQGCEKLSSDRHTDTQIDRQTNRRTTSKLYTALLRGWWTKQSFRSYSTGKHTKTSLSLIFTNQFTATSFCFAEYRPNDYFEQLYFFILKDIITIILSYGTYTHLSKKTHLTVFLRRSSCKKSRRKFCTDSNVIWPQITMWLQITNTRVTVY